MKPNIPYWLVATDLDGTLLDGEYDHGQAARAVDALSLSQNVQVVLASSKTLLEMVDLAQRCASDPLLVFENGSGLAWRSTRLKQRGTGEYRGFQVQGADGCLDYQSLRQLLLSWREIHGFRFRGFGDLSPAQIAQLTGLGIDGAELASQRLYTEPLIWDDSEARLKVFTGLLQQHQLKLLAGGRFLHVMPDTDKAEALLRARQLLAELEGEVWGLVACGDADNDRGMLEAADLALVFPDAAGGYLLPRSASVHHACNAGPDGWLSSLTRLLSPDTLTKQRTTLP